MIDPVFICSTNCDCKNWKHPLFLMTRKESLAEKLSYSMKVFRWDIKKHPKAKRVVTLAAARVD